MSKWLIEKCKRGRSCWHVYSPRGDSGDEWDDQSFSWEFRTGAEAIAFVQHQLAAGVSQ